MESQSKFRDQPFVQYLQNAWRVKLTHCAIGVILCGALVTLILRTRPMPFQASVRMFAQMSRKGQSNTTAAVSIPEMERITFIASQEELLTSYPLYLKVRRNYKGGDWPVDENSASNQSTSKILKLTTMDGIRSVLNKVLFGKDYAEDALEWNDNDFTLFVKRLSFEQKPSSGTFTITYSDIEPRRALLITKLLADSLVELNYDIMNKKKSSLIQYLEGKKIEARSRVEESRKKISDFLIANDFSDNDAVIDAKIKQYSNILEGYNQELRDKEAERVGAELTKQYVEATTKSIQNNLDIASDQNILVLNAQLAELEATKLKRENIYGIESDQYDLQINSTKKKLNSILKAGIPIGLENKNKLINELQQLQIQREINLASKLTRFKITEQIKNKYEMEIKRFPELQATLANYLSDYQQNLKLLQLVSESLVNTSIQGDSELTQLFSIQEPMISNPTLKKGLKLFIGFLASSILFMITFGIYHLLRGTIFSKYDLVVPDVPKHYFIGSIPNQSKMVSGRLTRFFGGNDAILKDAQSLKHHLESENNSVSNVIQFWSSADSSGKSVTTFAMALALKDLGNSVIVLDCDFRKGTAGLLKYAAKEKNRRNISVQNNLEGVLNYLESESTENPSENDDAREFTSSKVVISSPVPSGSTQKEAYVYFDTKFQNDVIKLKKYFDFILLDAPPLSLGQGLLTSPIADAIVLCCPEGRINQNAYCEMLRYIESYCGDKTKILSVITMSRLRLNKDAMEIGNRDRTVNRKLKVAA